MKASRLVTMAFAATFVFIAACEEQASRKPSSQTPPPGTGDKGGPSTQNNGGGTPTNPDNGGDQNKVIGKLKAKVDTRFKINEVDYTDNLSNQPDVFCRLSAGTEFELVAEPQKENKYLRVSLAKAPGTCTFTEGLLYIPYLECAGSSGDPKVDCLIK